MSHRDPVSSASPWEVSPPGRAKGDTLSAQREGLSMGRLAGLGEAVGQLELTTRWTWALGLGFAVAVAPFVFLAIQGLLGLAAAAVLGLAGVHAAPVLAQRLAHWQLGALRREARRNPLISLEKQLIDRREALAQATGHLQLALARIDHFVEQAGAQASRQPEAAARWHGRIEQAQALRVRKLAALREASAAVEAFGQAVERARVEWSLVEAEQAMNQALGQATGQSRALEQLLERSALDSVREQMNRAFASLETEMAVRAGQDALPGSAHPSLSIDPSPGRVS